MWQGELRQVRKDRTAVFVSAQWVLTPDGNERDPLIIATHTEHHSRLECTGTSSPPMSA